jgi:glyoxylase-like metal-dependent hydrolase (beta-lactamase superfamily II)
MRIGKYELTSVNSGFFKLDGGAMFGIIPKVLWSRTNPSDEINRIKLATRNLLLVSDTRRILVDTGMGNKFDEKSRIIYDIEQNEFTLDASLRSAGYTSDDITDVILTHLHFDHTGGSTIMENDKPVPAFRNARYHVSEKNFNWAVNPSDRDKGSYLKENFVPLAEEGVLCFFKESSFDDEIELIEINGHTFGQNMIKISDSSNTVLYCADLLPFISHIPLPYIMGYDLQPLVTLEEKKRILPQAAEEEWILFFEHDPESTAARVKITGKGFTADVISEIF